MFVRLPVCPSVLPDNLCVCYDWSIHLTSRPTRVRLKYNAHCHRSRVYLHVGLLAPEPARLSVCPGNKNNNNENKNALSVDIFLFVCALFPNNLF